MVLERTERTPPSSIYESSNLALEVLADGIASGFTTRLQQACSNPWKTGGEVVGSLAASTALGMVAAKPIGKFGMLAAGAFAAYDLGSRLLTTAGSVADTVNHPDHYDHNKSEIAHSLGAAAFDYGVIGLAGGAGFKFGRNIANANANTRVMTLLSAERPREIGSVLSEAAQHTDASQIAIPQFTANSVGLKAPSYVISDRNSGLGKFYLDNKNSVVRIFAERPSGDGGVGTGFFVNKDGMITTNNHVFSGMDRLAVQTSDGSKFLVQVLARDRVADLALLQVVNKPQGMSFRPIELAESGNLPAKSFVSAIGHPEGVSQEVMALGQIKGFSIESERPSIIGRLFKGFAPGSKKPSEFSYIFDSTPRAGEIVTDLPVIGGYSGSPLLTDSGKVIGVVRAKMDNQSVATSVEHLSLLIRETQAKIPSSGYLDLASGFDSNFGNGRAFRLGEPVRKFEWPVDASNPLDPNRTRVFVQIPEYLKTS